MLAATDSFLTFARTTRSALIGRTAIDETSFQALGPGWRSSIVRAVEGRRCDVASWTSETVDEKPGGNRMVRRFVRPSFDERGAPSFVVV